MRKGGEKWKQGAETCVFKPAVRCKGETDRPSGISRVQPKSIAADEQRVEEVLKTKFEPLIANGSITVSDRVCEPEFDAKDLEEGAVIQVDTNQGIRRACSRLDTNAPLTNFITPEINGVPYAESPIQRESPSNQYKVIRNILEAVIQLVPDAGPWVIHTDLHTRNILVRNTNPPPSTIIDWGRSIVIENPQNDTEVTAKIEAHKQKIGVSKHRGINDIVFSPRATIHAKRNALRGWMVYSLLKEVFEKTFKRQPVSTYSDRETILDINEDLLGLLQQPTQTDITEWLKMFEADLKQKYPKEGGMYWPTKYFRGLTRKQNLERKRSATRRTKMSWKNPKAYTPFKSDKGAKTRRSSYTSRFHAKYPEAKSVSEIAKATGISKSILQEVYDRGMAAWRTGHRPGASQHAWGMARVHSFVMKGKTWRTADSDLARKV